MPEPLQLLLDANWEQSLICSVKCLERVSRRRVEKGWGISDLKQYANEMEIKWHRDGTLKSER